MKLLTKEQMIATTKTTRGLIVTICKYDYYQSPENYETNSETNNEQTMNKQSSHTIIYKNERSKEEYYKEKIYKKEKFNFLSELKKIGVKEEVAKSWMEVRKNKKAVNTKIAFDRIKKEIEATGVPANDCITFAVENSWSGFKSEWYSNKKGAFKVPTTFQNF